MPLLKLITWVVVMAAFIQAGADQDWVTLVALALLSFELVFPSRERLR